MTRRMDTMFDDPRFRYGIPLALDAGAVGLATALHDGLAAYQASARFTARVSLVLFVTLALLHAVPHRGGRARELMAPFAAVHVFHLACVASYLQVLGAWPQPATLLGGGVAYLLIIVMPVLQQLSGARTRAVAEAAYLGWVGFFFLMSYLLRVIGKVPGAGGSPVEHQALFGVVLAALAAYLTLRIRAWRHAKGETFRRLPSETRSSLR